MLSNYQLGGKALLQSFLVGQPELRSILQGPDMQQFRQRVIASYHLTPLDREDTQGYIEHRLKQVRWCGDPTITDEAYDAIYAFTAGIPRRINLICNRLLLAGYLNEKHVLEDGDVEAVAAELKEELGLMAQDTQIEVRRVSGSEVPAVLRRPIRLHATTHGQPAPRVDGMDDGEGIPGDGPLPLRIARLERTMSLVRRMLVRVVRVMEAGS